VQVRDDAEPVVADQFELDAVQVDGVFVSSLRLTTMRNPLEPSERKAGGKGIGAGLRHFEVHHAGETRRPARHPARRPVGAEDARRSSEIWLTMPGDRADDGDDQRGSATRCCHRSARWPCG
jgi:hypothetical protein